MLTSLCRMTLRVATESRVLIAYVVTVLADLGKVLFPGGASDSLDTHLIPEPADTVHVLFREVWLSL